MCIRIKGVKSVVLGCCEHDVMYAAPRNCQPRDVERLRVHMTVHRISEELAERSGVDVCGGQDCFVQVHAGAAIVVVVGQDVHVCPSGEKRRDPETPKSKLAPGDERPHLKPTCTRTTLIIL